MAKANTLPPTKEQDIPTDTTRETAMTALAYEPDDGPLTPDQVKAIQQQAYTTSPMPIGPPRKIKRLFDNL